MATPEKMTEKAAIEDLAIRMRDHSLYIKDAGGEYWDIYGLLEQAEDTGEERLLAVYYDGIVEFDASGARVATLYDVIQRPGEDEGVDLIRDLIEEYVRDSKDRGHGIMSPVVVYWCDRDEYSIESRLNLEHERRPYYIAIGEEAFGRIAADVESGED